ncbi:Methyl-accepting chemotaxis protein (MCP) signalling domain-containing protein, partial [Oryzisolibacter propanilivorax]
RSAEAAKEIKQLIGASVDSVQAGSAQVEQAGQGMHGIVEGVRRVGELIAEITASSAEQANGIGQVNQAVAQLDQMTQQNAALVEQSSAAAAAMHEQAQRLAQVVAVFRVGQEAPATGARPLPRAAAAMPAPRLADGAGKPRMPAPAAIKKAAAPAPAAPRIAAPPRAELAMAGAQDDWESF